MNEEIFKQYKPIDNGIAYILGVKQPLKNKRPNNKGKYNEIINCKNIQEPYKSFQRQQSLPMQGFQKQVLGVIREDSGILNITLGYILNKNPLMTLGTEYFPPKDSSQYSLQQLIKLAQEKEQEIGTPVVIVPDVLQPIGFNTTPIQRYNDATLVALDSIIEEK